MENTDRKERLYKAQTFTHQFVIREIRKFRELLKIRRQIIQTLGKILQEEIIANGVFLLPGQLGIKMIGSGFEIHFAEQESSPGAKIFSYSYLNQERRKFSHNDPKGLLNIIAPFMEEIISKSGNEILCLVEEMERENE